METDDKCVLCDENLHVGQTVNVTRGLGKIISSSERRNDGIAGKIHGKISLIVHTDCRKSYTRNASVGDTCPPSTSAKALRSSLTNVFDFTHHCLFCGSECNKTEDEKRARKRRDVFEIRSLTVKNSILSAATRRNDEWGRVVRSRLDTIIDLVAAEAIYHNSCYKDFFYVPTGKKRGRPEDEELNSAFDRLVQYLQGHDECQYSLEQLHEKLRQFSTDGSLNCNEKTLKRKLIHHFGDDVIITSIPGRKNVACFRDTGYKIINNSWYAARSADEKAERLRIVKAAAAIIREDIRSMNYQTDEYPSAGNAFDPPQLKLLIPETLDLLLNDVINKKKKRKEENRSRKCTVMAHQIISATRPRSFVSMIMVGLSTYVHRHVGSRHVVDVLNSMGVCASYYEARRYEASAMATAPPTLQSDSFIQFVFDNADFNVRTMTGHGTFHSMGGIMCVTPGDAVEKGNPIKRIEEESASIIAQSPQVQIPLHHYVRPRNAVGIDGITIEDIEKIKCLDGPTAGFHSDFNAVLWMCGPWLKIEQSPSWHGFMELITQRKSDYQTSKVIVLPFVNLQPTSLDAVYTVLRFAAAECRKHERQTAIVTFDQPLYAKAVEMVAATEHDSELSSVIVRLGGFHLLMSFMGAVGYIMGGSGLKELWSQIYAQDSIEKMLSGHSYSRALRAHLLTQSAMAMIFLDALEMDEYSRTYLKNLYGSTTTRTVADEQRCDSVLKSLTERLENFKSFASATSRTSKLWIQYFDQVTLIRNFVQAERCGNWQLHLQTIKNMLPYFHAAGHLAYARYAHLYLQQMASLDNKMSAVDFNKFTSMGNFTIRRSEKMWSGVWTDMTIEQVLMRAMKTSGGLTRGRGITDTVLNRWVLGMPLCTELTNNFEEFCGVHFSSSEQHVELRKSRKLRDNRDIHTFFDWLMGHPPLPKDDPSLKSIGSGIVASDAVINCDSANLIGLESIKRLYGMTFGSIHLHRKDRIMPLLAITSTVKIRDEIVPVNTMQLFNRIICLIKSHEDLASCLEFELAPRPLSLFDELSMRKTEKAVMYRVMKACAPCVENPVDCQTFVIDGGFLLRKVVWPQSGTYKDVISAYVSYVKRKYGNNTCLVVFDGYGNGLSTKTIEQTRRAKSSQSSADINFSEDMAILIRQERFLSNSNNKARLIDKVAANLLCAQVQVIKAVADADTTIVQSAIEMSKDREVVVVGTDSDLLMLLTQFTPPGNRIYLLKPGIANNSDEIYDIALIQSQLPSGLKDCLLFLHAMTGCDTTSALYGQGKKKAFNLLKKNIESRECAQIFNSDTSTASMIVTAGERFLLTLYGAPRTTTSLNEHRYHSLLRPLQKAPFIQNYGWHHYHPPHVLQNNSQSEYTSPAVARSRITAD